MHSVPNVPFAKRPCAHFEASLSPCCGHPMSENAARVSHCDIDCGLSVNAEDLPLLSVTTLVGAAHRQDTE